MTDTKELNSLIEKVRNMGGVVNVELDEEGYIDSVQISNLKGVGPYAMSPIAAAECMRRAVANGN